MYVVQLIFHRIPTLVRRFQMLGVKEGPVEEGILEGKSFTLAQIFPSICTGTGRAWITVQQADLVVCKSTVQFHF